jgi:hypothetical protein
MKTFKSILFLSLVTLFFACEKEEPLVEPPTEITVTYRFVTRGAPELHEVRFWDENYQMQTVTSPSPDWQYSFVTEQGFLARMEVDGYIPKGTNSFANCIIDGSGYGSWSSFFFQSAPGDFSIVNEYQLGDK